MCGIAGFWGKLAQTDEARSRLERMTTAIAHRGPDGQAYWLDDDVGLGHARLAVIDLHSGDQPMWDAQKQTVIVFNGEIYNYRELRSELEHKGFTFCTQSDTEVIIAAIKAWGVEVGLLRLRGMFAFALYDSQRQSLLLARDRVGIKPLYYATVTTGLLFGSEPKALLAAGVLSQRVNVQAIHDYLAQGYAITPATCWADIHLLEPGTWLEIGPQGLRQGKYWHWHTGADSTLSLAAATEKTKQVLYDALRCHLIADVPVAAFLSGGLDSSLNVALLSQGLRPGIKTFTVGFVDPEFDESHLAREVAEQFKTEHYESYMRSDDGDPDLFVRVVNQYDEPFGDSSCLPTYLVCGEMRKQAKVALSGDGGDEILGGYVRYLQASWLAKLAHLQPAEPVISPLINVVGRQLGRRGFQMSKAWHYAQQTRAAMLLGLHTYFSEQERMMMYQPDFAQIVSAAGPTVERFTKFVPHDEPDAIKQLIAAEFHLRLHADYLRKIDVASSAHGLEVRVPYLDNKLLDLAMTLPTRYKIGRQGNTKLIARRLAQELLPPRLAQQPQKGFSIPLDHWIGPRMQTFLGDLLFSSQTRLYDWVKPEAVTNTWRAFIRPAKGNQVSRFQRYQRVFLLISLELWLRRWQPTL